MSSVSNVSAGAGGAYLGESGTPRTTPAGRDTQCATPGESNPIPAPGDELKSAMTINEKDSKTDQAFAYRLNAQINGQLAQAYVNEINQGTQTVKGISIQV